MISLHQRAAMSLKQFAPGSPRCAVIAPVSKNPKGPPLSSLLRVGPCRYRWPDLVRSAGSSISRLHSNWVGIFESPLSKLADV